VRIEAARVSRIGKSIVIDRIGIDRLYEMQRMLDSCWVLPGCDFGSRGAAANIIPAAARSEMITEIIMIRR
jgi:hypothetical protein